MFAGGKWESNPSYKPSCLRCFHTQHADVPVLQAYSKCTRVCLVWECQRYHLPLQDWSSCWQLGNECTDAIAIFAACSLESCWTSLLLLFLFVYRTANMQICTKNNTDAPRAWQAFVYTQLDKLHFKCWTIWCMLHSSVYVLAIRCVPKL